MYYVPWMPIGPHTGGLNETVAGRTQLSPKPSASHTPTSLTKDNPCIATSGLGETNGLSLLHSFVAVSILRW